MNTIYFKTVLRNLWKRKSYGLLNIFGLAIGIACATLIFLWVEDELTFDHSFQNRKHLYQVMENQISNADVRTVWTTPGPMTSAIKAEIPGIKNATRSTKGDNIALFSIDDKVFYEKGGYVDAPFFSMFDLNFIEGKRLHAFDQRYSIVISEKMAKRFFGEGTAFGRTLKMDNDQLYTIAGVMKDLPENSSLKFDWLAPFDLIAEKYDWIKRWDAASVVTLVELEPESNVEKVNEQLKGYLKTKVSGNDTECFLFPMSDWHLYAHFSNGKQDGDGQIKYVKLFMLIASLILIIACVNFMNLATARSEQRAKEVGVRKTLGSGRARLISQFISEALVMSCLAVMVSILFIYLALPSFNSLVEKNLEFEVTQPLHWGGLIFIGLASGLLAGSYPAFYLSSFNPVEVLKGLKARTSKGSNFIRQGLVVTQFVVSITLIICTIIIYQQIQHTKNRDLGYERSNVLYMDVRGKMQDHFNSLKASLLNTNVVENVTMSMNPTFQLGWFSGDSYTWQGKNPNKDVEVIVEAGTPEYISTMGMKLKDGRDFYAVAENDVNNVIINESMAEQMGGGNQVGNVITQFDSSNPEKSWKMKVIGVVEDFVFGNVYGADAAPMILICNPAQYNVLTMRLKPGESLMESLVKIESVMKAFNPEYPFDYKFLDDEFNKLFKTESLIEKLAGVFAGLGIFISCLGLFGLAAYTAGSRTKEISIRKVLGASVNGITQLLSRDFLRLVLIACLVSFPISWWLMHSWLESYEYSTTIHWWVFALTGFGALLIALITVSFQTLKAAFTNPATSLRRE
ncbi:MAG: ABC transporter permease [Chryseolinea sp.]